MNFTSQLLAAGVVLSGAMFSFSAEAVNRIYINDFTIENYDVKEVQVMLENTDPASQTLCHVVLPAGLELAGTPAVNAERFPLPYITQAKPTVLSDGTTDVYITCLQMAGPDVTFLGGNSAMATIPVKAKEGMLDKESTESINITGIEITAPNADKIEQSKTSQCTVTFAKEVEVEKMLSISCTDKDIIVNPGDTKTVSLRMDNTVEVFGLQMDIFVPENVKIGNVKGSYRVPATMMTSLNYSENRGCYTLMLLGVGNAVISGESGDFISFDIIAGEEFFKSGEVTFARVKSTDTAYATFEGTAAPFQVVSGYVAMEKAAMDIEALNEYLTKANNTINEECPLVADDFSVFPLYQEVEALTQEIEKAYNDYTLTPDYATVVTAPIEALKAKIDAQVAAAKDAQAKEEKRRADNKAAYEGDLAAIGALQAALDAAKEQVRKQYPDFVDEEAENAIQNEINAAKAAVEAAYKAVEEEGNYDYKLNADEITAEIAELLPAAAEAYRVDTNEKAYNADIAKIDALLKEYNDGIEQIKKVNPSFLENNEDAADILSQIDDARKACDDEYDSVKTEGFYESPDFDVQAISDAIKALVEAGVVTGIESISADMDLTGVEIYTLDGMRHPKLVIGQINILKTEKQVRKVVVK